MTIALSQEYKSARRSYLDISDCASERRVSASGNLQDSVINEEDDVNDVQETDGNLTQGNGVKATCF